MASLAFMAKAPSRNLGNEAGQVGGHGRGPGGLLGPAAHGLDVGGEKAVLLQEGNARADGVEIGIRR